MTNDGTGANGANGGNKVRKSVDFASPKFFYFYGEALFGRIRLASRGQLVVRAQVRRRRWGDIRGIRPRWWDSIRQGVRRYSKMFVDISRRRSKLPHQVLSIFVIRWVAVPQAKV
jgi:hypothetical protein